MLIQKIIVSYCFAGKEGNSCDSFNKRFYPSYRGIGTLNKFKKSGE